MKRVISGLLLPCFLCVCLLASGCTLRDPEPRNRLFYEYFDTVSGVYSFGNESDAEFSENAELCHSLLKKYHELLDAYHEYDGIVNVATLNRTAGAGAVEVSRELFDFLSFAVSASERTGGVVSPTVGAVTSLWHEKREQVEAGGVAEVPEDSDITEALLHIALSSLILDEDALTVRFADDKLKLDVGAFGKGYVLKLTAEALSEKGVSSYLLNYGGNVVAVGAKVSGDAFHVGLKNPFGQTGYSAVIQMKNASLSTSGSYERKLTVGDKTYSHIIDTKTGYPVENFASVSVLGADPALGDALSTALFCLSREEGETILESFGADGYWIYSNGTAYGTAGFLAKKVQ